MITVVKVIVELEVEHDERMPVEDVIKLAEEDLHHSRTSGTSFKY